MLNRIFLPGIFVVLAYGFWISPEFKVIAAGLAIFLFGMLALEEGFRVFTDGTFEVLLDKATEPTKPLSRPTDQGIAAWSYDSFHWLQGELDSIQC